MQGLPEILIATGNPKKFQEIVAVLVEDAPHHELNALRWRSLADVGFDVPEPEEDEPTFFGNARLKARYYSKQSGLWTLADDSGLEVDALSGAPGVHSARYAGLPSAAGRAVIDAANNRKLILALAGVPAERRSARFRCALALADGERILAEAAGAIEGVIVDEPRGANGFGYDPHFFVPELGRTTAELSPTEKNAVSHRGRALAAMSATLAGLVGMSGAGG